jgi:hypothetical protein
VDVLTPYEVIEIKCWERAYQGIQQLAHYGLSFPDRRKRLVLFGRRPSPRMVERVLCEAQRAGIEPLEYDPRKLRFWLGWKLTDSNLADWTVPVSETSMPRLQKTIPAYADPRYDVIMNDVKPRFSPEFIGR